MNVTLPPLLTEVAFDPAVADWKVGPPFNCIDAPARPTNVSFRLRLPTSTFPLFSIVMVYSAMSPITVFALVDKETVFVASNMGLKFNLTSVTSFCVLPSRSSPSSLTSVLVIAPSSV